MFYHLPTDVITAATPDAKGAWGPGVSILPLALLKAARTELDHRHVDDGQFEIDFQLATLASHHQRTVGFWRGAQVLNELVCEPDPPSGFHVSAEEGESIGMTLAAFDALMEAVDAPSLFNTKSRRAFCGWLTTNPQFVAEHDAFWGAHLHDLARFGIPMMGPAVPPASFGAGHQVRQASGPLADLMAAFETFLRRWRLAQLTGPRLPLPFDQQTTALSPATGLQAGHGEASVVTIQLARTSPTMPAEMLRQTLEDALDRDGHGGNVADSNHLQAWHRLVAKASMGKRALDRYARLFPLQHYWRVLHARYGAACRRRGEALEAVFAKFLRVAVGTVHADLQFIRRRLGPDWAAATPAT